MPNTRIETVLTGEVWKVICINLDLENVGIELLNSHSSNIAASHKANLGLQKDPLAHLAFLKSTLIYESFSDQSKLIDLVSSEILVIDISSTEGKQGDAANLFVNILCNPSTKKPKTDSVKRLQLELHYRSNKVSNRYSILINNCRVIAVLDWIVKVKNFLSSNYERDQTTLNNNSRPINKQHHQQSVGLDDILDKLFLNRIFDFLRLFTIKKESSSQVAQQPIEIKLNLTNTDLVLVEKTNDFNSQAVILRLTAFIEYNQRKLARPFESCLQSVELFSCQMNAIEETALSIIDPVTFSILLSAKNTLNNSSINNDEEYCLRQQLDTYKNNPSAYSEFSVDISAEMLKLRFSYLDFKLFLRLLDSINKQFHMPSTSTSSAKSPGEGEVQPKTKRFVQSIKLNMCNFCLCIIDDCKDVDVPLTDVQFNRIKLVHSFGLNQDSGGQGSAEFSLNVDYYNRLLSGWEPLVEPWLARLNWRFKHAANSFTLTSMDVLNVNVTNPFMDLITGVLANWRDEYENEKANFGYTTKRHKIFQPYKLINLTGQKIEYCTFKDTNTSSVEFKQAETSGEVAKKKPELDSISSEWTPIEDKCQIQFNFYEQTK